ncbi:FecR family protein [Dyadobacter psychrophilus]|uniref:FecR family protein n=1 Tax=Dyadobacter psychrophilus TaxID=651661 RepID=A0A1T5G815_9BACT|nr:FecR domain-containing protein [Dyadobacter psychrophilus]SKC04633.1 FecR family protein [Dyadobacter psychrophilus]
MKHPKPSSEILRKYLTGACSEAESQEVNDWYQSLDAEHPELWTGAEEENLYNRIQVRIAEQEKSHLQPAPVATFWTYALRIAAVLCIGLGISYYFYSDPAKPVSVTKAHVSNWVSFENQEKKVNRYTLPDSTTVWLSPGATLSYARDFEKRQVRFSGEGFFDVKPDKLHPFEILSGDMKTRVLGTSFNVRANAGEATCQVTVVTGVVEVESVKEKRPVVLRPKQQVVFAKNSNALTVQTLSENRGTKEIWQSVSLVFDEVPMDEVAERLGKIFKVSIDFKDPQIKKCRLKVDFNNQRLPEILDMIDALLGTTYQIEGDKITFGGEGCH